jgi:hypothetical protein
MDIDNDSSSLEERPTRSRGRGRGILLNYISSNTSSPGVTPPVTWYVPPDDDSLERNPPLYLQSTSPIFNNDDFEAISTEPPTQLSERNVSLDHENQPPSYSSLFGEEGENLRGNRLLNDKLKTLAENFILNQSRLHVEYQRERQRLIRQYSSTRNPTES